MKSFDIFISYRHEYTADKAEHLLTILESSGYKGRVSFDKDNLNHRFDVELLRRIDNCKDFIIIISENTFTNIKHEETEFYKKLSTCNIEDFDTICKQDEIKRLDFTRLELARAIAQNKNIIPIVPQKTKKYDFDEIDRFLPIDIKTINKYQGIIYSQADSYTFNALINTKMLGKNGRGLLISKPDSTYSWISLNTLIITIIAFIFCCILYFTITDFIKVRDCSSINDYQEYIYDKYSLFDKYAKRKINEINEFLNFDNEFNEYVSKMDRGTININQAYAISSILNNMVYIKGGGFLMGSDLSDNAADSIKERPKHKVTIENFYIGRYEVSVGEWNGIMGQKPKSNNQDSLSLPIVNISWNDIQVFIKTLNNILPINFRLPHEKEWEYAATGGTKSKGYIYSGSNDIKNVAWTIRDSIYQPKFRPHDGIDWWRDSNELELYNMSGNVAELCCNSFYYYSDTTRIFNKDLKIIRGGSYTSSVNNCRVRARDMISSSSKDNSVGFRLVFSNE